MLRFSERVARVGLVLVAIAPLAGCSLLFPPRAIRDGAEAAVVRAPAGPLEAGAARVEITPKGNLYLAGFGVGRVSQGVHDPLFARALAVRRGAATAVVVAVDLIGLHHHQVEEVRRRLSGRVSPTCVLVAATHNHAGPDTLGLWGVPPFVSGIDRSYVELATSGIVRAAEMALDALGPARIRRGEAQAPSEGVTRNLREPAVIDRTVTALAFERPDGAPVATLVHFTCHPEVLGGRNRLVSADFPAALCAELEEARPGGVAIFLNGPLGGMVTACEKDESFGEAERIGREVACTALRALESAEPFPAEVDLACVRQPILVPIQNRRYHLGNLFGLFNRRPYLSGGYTVSEVMALRLGPATLLTAPGEVLPRVGFELQALGGAARILVVSLGNDELGYLIHEDDYSSALYSYERTVSPGPLTVTLLRAAAADALALVRPEDPVTPERPARPGGRESRVEGREPEDPHHSTLNP